MPSSWEQTGLLRAKGLGLDGVQSEKGNTSGLWAKTSNNNTPFTGDAVIFLNSEFGCQRGK